MSFKTKKENEMTAEAVAKAKEHAINVGDLWIVGMTYEFAAKPLQPRQLYDDKTGEEIGEYMVLVTKTGNELPIGSLVRSRKRVNDRKKIYPSGTANKYLLSLFFGGRHSDEDIANALLDVCKKFTCVGETEVECVAFGNEVDDKGNLKTQFHTVYSFDIEDFKQGKKDDVLKHIEKFEKDFKIFE